MLSDHAGLGTGKRQRPTERVCLVEAGELKGGRIPLLHQAVGVEDRHSVEGGIDDSPLVLALLLGAVERARVRKRCTRGVRQELENAKLSAPNCTPLGNEEDVQRTGGQPVEASETDREPRETPDGGSHEK